MPDTDRIWLLVLPRHRAEEFSGEIAVVNRRRVLLVSCDLPTLYRREKPELQRYIDVHCVHNHILCMRRVTWYPTVPMGQTKVVLVRRRMYDGRKHSISTRHWNAHRYIETINRRSTWSTSEWRYNCHHAAWLYRGGEIIGRSVETGCDRGSSGEISEEILYLRKEERRPSPQTLEDK